MSDERRYVLLDRDGTVIVDKHYLSDPDDVELLPGAAEGLARMREAGLGLVLITNQSGVGRGYFDEAAVQRCNERLKWLLATHHVSIDAIYHCPHAPEESCPCRKPAPGMVTLAAQDLGFLPSQAFVIGDKACDVELGRTVGATTLLVVHGQADGATCVKPGPDNVGCDYVVRDLREAAAIIEDMLGDGDETA
jgi:D-glycero-D-manno-heptose 1,7-bisphosphate phosphatase